jgi:hypothetical protein
VRKKKPFTVLEERVKYNYIVIELFKRQNIFSFGLSTSIRDGGMGRPGHGAYRSFFEAKNTALHYIVDRHQSTPQQAVLRKFRLIEDLDQSLLFDDI